MRTSQTMVPSLGALLFAAFTTLTNCGAPTPTPGADREDVGPAADASTADRAISEDRPAVLDGSVDNDAADASLPPDAAPADVTPPEDVSPPDSGLPMCAPGTLSVAGERCRRELPPGMPRGEFTVAAQVCTPVSVTLISGTVTETMPLDCRLGADGLTYMDVSPICPGMGFLPCIGEVCFDYRGPTTETRGVIWNASPCSGRPASWAAGMMPGVMNATRIPDGNRVTCR